MEDKVLIFFLWEKDFNVRFILTTFDYPSESLPTRVSSYRNSFIEP